MGYLDTTMHQADFPGQPKTLEGARKTTRIRNDTPEIKRTVQNFLAVRAYKNAPVTLDNSGYLFAAYYAKMLARHNMPEAERTHKEYIRDMVSIFIPAPV